MEPSSDFRQQHLPFGLGRACEQLRPDYQAKVDRWADQRKKEDDRARYIESYCAQFRKDGNDVRLVKPVSDPRLHITVNGRVVGAFTEHNGTIEFCKV